MFSLFKCLKGHNFTVNCLGCDSAFSQWNRHFIDKRKQPMLESKLIGHIPESWKGFSVINDWLIRAGVDKIGWCETMVIILPFSGQDSFLKWQNYDFTNNFRWSTKVSFHIEIQSRLQAEARRLWTLRGTWTSQKCLSSAWENSQIRKGQLWRELKAESGICTSFR